MDIVRKVKELNLPDGGYVVIGSSVMDVLGIREAIDIDLVVSPEVYEKLRQEEGWEEKFLYGMNYLIKDEYEVWLSWDNENNEPNLKDLLNGAHIIEGMSFVDIKRLLDWKKRKGRDKDLIDVGLIEKYLESKS